MPTPMTKNTKDSTSEISYSNPLYHRSTVSALQYLTVTKLDLTFSVNFDSHLMHNRTEVYYNQTETLLYLREDQLRD